MNKKKIIIIIVAVVAASLLLGGASAVVIHKVREAKMEEQAEMRAEQRKKRADEKKKAEAEQAAAEKNETETEPEPEPETESEPEIEIEDPLAGNPDVVYLGDKDGNDAATRNIVQKLLADKNIDPMSVLSVCSSDFAGDGQTEAFIFTGEFVQGDFLDHYDGTFWYVDEDEIDEFEPSISEMWFDSGRFSDFGNRKYYLITELYTTGAPSDIWTVVDGKPFKDKLSGYGNVEMLQNGTGIVYHDIYDGIWDNELGGYIGHTFKPYYFYYDEGKDQLCEFESEPVTEEQLNDLCGHDILGDIKNAGGTFSGAYKRANGLVTINYAIDIDNETDCCNATWNLNTNAYKEIYEGSGATLAGSDFGGTYERYLTELQ